MNRTWRKFYECSCMGEGIMLSYEYEEDFSPMIDMAFFGLGMSGRQPLTLKERLRWCWRILRYGYPFTDQVMLRPETAKKLGNDLVNFYERSKQ